MTATEQRDSARQMANDKRRRLAILKRGLRNGTITLSEVMMDPPEDLLRYPLVDIVRFSGRQGHPLGRSVTTLGRLALRDRVNLMVALGDASARSRAWVAEQGTQQWRRGA